MATEKIDLNNLDKSDWKTYRFDEIAQNISERVDPNNTDLEVYIGLEHIDSESLHIKRHGTPDDVNGTKLKFYKGDIIFGRRRAYQRKAGIATCDGFCSAHALVLRANPDVIDPDLFPFFMHSDLFMNRAVDISVGSLSPTINWGTLKHQKFFIPPKRIQKQLAELFFLKNKLVTNSLDLLDKINTLKLSFVKEVIFEKSKMEKIEFIPLGSIFDIKTGNKNAQDSVENGEYPFFTRSIETQRIDSYEFDQEALILPGEGNFQIKYFNGKFNLHQRTYLLTDNKKHSVNLRLYRDIVQFMVVELTQKSVGSTVNSLRKPIIEAVKIPIIPFTLQDELFTKTSILDKAFIRCEIQVFNSKALQSTLVNKVF